MNLANDRFYDAIFCYRIGANGPTLQARRLSYESHGKLYDVSLYPEGRKYAVNGFFVDIPTPYHRAIEEHFALPREIAQ